jgi:tetratricopeptide (TPR) repeat protein
MEKNEMKTYLRLMGGIGVLTVGAAMGLGSDTRCPVNGEITPAGAGVGSLTVELSPTGQGPAESVLVNQAGTFEMRSVEPGMYELRVFGAGGTVVHQENVIISCGHGSLSVRIPEYQSTSRPGDSISVRQLMHKVPPPARKAFEKGQQAETKGNHEQAQELFRQAVSIDPEFADAYNELGASEAAQGDFPRAIGSFQSAIDIVPDHRLALSNLCIVLAKSRKFDEAAAAARRALRYVPTNGTVRYILATSLLFMNGDSEEVLDNLERSSGDIPFAHLLAAEILARRGKRSEAARHVEDYLKVVPADDKHRSRAEAMLADLRS